MSRLNRQPQFYVQIHTTTILETGVLNYLEDHVIIASKDLYLQILLEETSASNRSARPPFASRRKLAEMKLYGKYPLYLPRFISKSGCFKTVNRLSSLF